MSEHTRRDILKTGAAAVATVVAGCSNTGGDSNPTNLSEGEARYDAFNHVIDPNTLEERGAKNEEDMLFPRETFTVSYPEGHTETGQGGEGAHGPEVDSDEVLYTINHYSDIGSTAYDLSEEEIISGLVDAGYERDLETENLNSRDWELLINRSDIESDLDSVIGKVAAVKGNTAVFAPEHENPHDPDANVSLLDYEEGVQIAIDTYDGEIDSYTEGDGFESEMAATMRDFVDEGDLGEFEDAHGYTGIISEPSYLDEADENEPVGRLEVIKYMESGDYMSEVFLFDKNYEPTSSEQA